VRDDAARQIVHPEPFSGSADGLFMERAIPALMVA
jgi:hypothetical protein